MQMSSNGTSPNGMKFITPSPQQRASSPMLPNDPRNTPLGETFEELSDPTVGRLQHDFKDKKEVGRGKFSVVYRVTSNIDKQEYAVKALPRRTLGRNGEAPLEVEVLAKIATTDPRNEHLLRYFTSWWEEGCFYILLELCTGSLRLRLEQRRSFPQSLDPRFHELDLVSLLRQVSRGLAQLHDLGFAHLDVKPDNILTKEAPGAEVIYKVGDLGHVAVNTHDGGYLKNDLGDRIYMAPELLKPKGVNLAMADVFSFGLSCYEAGINPHELPKTGDEYHSLRSEGRIDESKLPSLSAQMLALLRSTLAAPALRPTCADIAQLSFIVGEADEAQVLREALRRVQEDSRQHRLDAERHRLQSVASTSSSRSSSRSRSSSSSSSSSIVVRRSRGSCC